MNPKGIFAAVLLALLVSLSGTARQETKPLTNADVVAMVKAGLSESTVLLAIEKGPTRFDTSPSALIELKNQGVPPAIIEAMLRTSTSGNPADSGAGGNADESEKTAIPESKSVSGATHVGLLEQGVYYKSQSGWVKLQQLTMAGGGAKHVAKVLVPGLTPQIVWTFRGAEAPVQISERRPTFYVKQSPYLAGVAGRSERDIVIVRFDKKKDHRELQTTSGGNMLTFKAGYSKERVPEITVTRVSESIFTVSPKEDLPPGEYVLTFGFAAASGYDFGIRIEK